MISTGLWGKGLADQRFTLQLNKITCFSMIGILWIFNMLFIMSLKKWKRVEYIQCLSNLSDHKNNFQGWANTSLEARDLWKPECPAQPPPLPTDCSVCPMLVRFSSLLLGHDVKNGTLRYMPSLSLECTSSSPFLLKLVKLGKVRCWKPGRHVDEKPYRKSMRKCSFGQLLCPSNCSNHIYERG